jgi:hypothetical protein
VPAFARALEDPDDFGEQVVPAAGELAEFGEYLSRYEDWARSVHPFLGPVPGPDPLPAAERWRIEALVTSYGSGGGPAAAGPVGECTHKPMGSHR